jgi:hypothetical protein
MRATDFVEKIILASLFLSSWIFLACPVFAEIVTFTYDDLNRLTSATYGASRINYVYDAAGNILQVVTPSGCDNLYYRDADGDSYGDPNASILSCTLTSGFVTDNTDCNDDPSTGFYEHPGQTWYPDADGDGYYAGPVNTTSCIRPIGHYAVEELVTVSVQDNSPLAYNPDQADFDADGVGDASDAFPNNFAYSQDIDGDGIADEWEMNNFYNLTTATVISDTDLDGISDLEEFTIGLDPNTSIYAEKDEEIYDLNEMINYLYLGDYDLDGDADGLDLQWFSARFGFSELDVDNDGDSFSEVWGDCDDTDYTIYPDAFESCDGLDNNCDGFVDEGCGG